MNPEKSKRIGVFLCCGRGEISRRIDLESLAKFISQYEDVVDVGIYQELSSKEGLEYLIGRYLEKKFDRILIGGGVPAIQGVYIQHGLTLAGMNKYLFEMVNLKEQCAWVTPDKKEATIKAKSIMLAGLERVRRLEPLEDIKVPVKDSVLVIGGGVAGMAAALHVASAGFKVYLVERTQQLGGRAYQLETTFPTHNCGICCMAYCKGCIFTPKIDEIIENPNIELLLNSEIDQITGCFGNRQIRVSQNGNIKEFDVGIIIVATGSKTFDPNKIPEYNYDTNKDVVTTMEFVKLMKDAYNTGIKRPSDGKEPQTVDIVLCVGSRDLVRGSLNCSLVCCTYAIGTAKEIKQINPKTTVYIHYIDLRGPYRGFERLYNEAKEIGIQFVRGKVAEIVNEDGQLFVRAEDTDAGCLLNIKSDLVILAVGQEPSVGSEKLSKMLHIPTDIDMFYKDVNPMLPADIRRGIYIAGCAMGPKGIRYSIEDAKSAAAEVIDILKTGYIMMDRNVAFVNEERCRGCGRCAEACTFKAIEIVEKSGKKVAKVNEILCRGCGVCAVTCCNKAVEVTNYVSDQIMPSVRSLVLEME
ncbi:MAG: FAD-dependent oxidoreductase [Methanomassiliicoccales archaeon]|nr:FAD-dependent oxidoreductase [Methanomassiliicoccales archaeon]